jgi:hypothetical protein
MKTCTECRRVFADEKSYKLHLSYDVKPGVHANSPEDAEARFPERAPCGNHQELLGRGLTWHGWLSVSGWRDDWWGATTG